MRCVSNSLGTFFSSMNIQSISSKKDALKKARKVRVKRIRKNTSKYGLLGLNILLVVSVLGFLLYGKSLTNGTQTTANIGTDESQGVAVLDQIG